MDSLKISQNKESTNFQYQKLVKDLQKLIEIEIDQANKNNDFQQIICYWQIGQKIYEQIIKKNLPFQNSALKNLSQDLNFDRSKLSRCLTFFQTYNTPPENNGLNWSHYRELITIKDEELRKKFQKQAIENSWSRQRLNFALKQYQNQLNKNDDGSILTRPKNNMYLYKSYVREIIDGDTIIANIDLGFDTFKDQRIRLANIDAAEIDTKEGQKAYDFLFKKLTNLDFIMIQTNKIDIYGRYIGHIFYDPFSTLAKDEIFTKGVYLNEEMLQAKIVEGY